MEETKSTVKSTSELSKRLMPSGQKSRLKARRSQALNTKNKRENILIPESISKRERFSTSEEVLLTSNNILTLEISQFHFSLIFQEIHQPLFCSITNRDLLNQNVRSDTLSKPFFILIVVRHSSISSLFQFMSLQLNLRSGMLKSKGRN